MFILGQAIGFFVSGILWSIVAYVSRYSKLILASTVIALVQISIACFYLIIYFGDI
jgi:hypothetical protein